MRLRCGTGAGLGIAAAWLNSNVPQSISWPIVTTNASTVKRDSSTGEQSHLHCQLGGRDLDIECSQPSCVDSEADEGSGCCAAAAAPVPFGFRLTSLARLKAALRSLRSVASAERGLSEPKALARWS